MAKKNTIIEIQKLLGFTKDKVISKKQRKKSLKNLSAEAKKKLVDLGVLPGFYHGFSRSRDYERYISDIGSEKKRGR